MLTVIISTMDERIMHLSEVLALRHPAIRYLIVHQTIEPRHIPEYLRARADVEVIQSDSRGLSRSRNIGLRHCRTSYALIADDDVTFVREGIIKILEIIQNDKPDFALFKIQTGEGEPSYKSYPDEAYVLDELRHWVSSIEILVRADHLRAEGIDFDERFGLGTPLARGEEEIFVRDLISQGWTGMYYPINIVKHPYESSGKMRRSQKEQDFFQGAFDIRVYRTPRERLEHLSIPVEEPRKQAYLAGRAYIAGEPKGGLDQGYIFMLIVPNNPEHNRPNDKGHD